MNNLPSYFFRIEWLPQEAQFYHGPRKRMKEMLFRHPVPQQKRLSQEQVIEHMIAAYPQYLHAIEKIKFYRVSDEGSRSTLHFFLVWCNFSVEAREELFADSEKITAATGWYPVITGHRIFHHQRHLLDIVDHGLRKAMSISDIEKLPGLGDLVEIVNFSTGTGTSILLKTTTYDLVLDTGMPDDSLRFDELRPQARKWLFVSHSHIDHTGGMHTFVNNKKYVIAISPISLELFLNAIAGFHDIDTYLPKDFFYRVAPMWYRSVYRFADDSSVQTIPTYHFPGSMGYLFTFSNGETLFYSGDLNVSASYLAGKLGFVEGNAFSFDLGEPFIDYGILDAAFVGRKIGSANNSVQDLARVIENSVIAGRNHLLLTPPSDYGYFLFLHLYDTLLSGSTRTVDTRLFLDPQIIKQLEIIEWRLKRKQAGSLDDALLRFLDKRITLGESVRVFDFGSNTESNLEQLSSRNIRTVFILDDQRVIDPGYLSPSAFALMKQPGIDITRLGKAATKPATADLLDNIPIADFDGHVWLLHSSEKMLMHYLLKGKQHYDQVYLFHNFKGRLERFVKQLQQSGYSGRIAPL